MLSKQSLDAAESLLPVLENNRIELTPCPDTPLGVVSGITSTPLNPSVKKDNEEGAGIFFMAADLLEQSQIRNAMGYSDHDAAMEEIISEAAAAIGIAQDIARNKVNPAIRRVVSEVERRLAQEGDSDTYSVQIQPRYHHKVWKNPALEAMVENYADASLMPLLREHPRNLVVADDLDYSKIFKSGFTELDENLQDILDELSEVNAQELVGAFYFGLNNGRTVGDLIQELSSSAPFKLILLHIVTLHFEANAATTDGASLAEFEGYNVQLKIITAKAIAERIRLLDKAVARKRLVISYPHSASIRTENSSRPAFVVVNHNVYLKFLDAGGTPETLLGAAIDDKETNFDQLIAEKSRYERQWARFQDLENLTRKNRVFNHTRGYLESAMHKEIDESEPDIFPHTQDEMKSRLKDCIGKLDDDCVDNLYIVARELVCKCIYFHTNALELLKEFDRVAEGQEIEDNLEVAFAVAVNYAADWVASQIMKSYTPE